MELLTPDTLEEAVAARSHHPGATPICGGTDLMVAMNFDHSRPDTFIDVSRIPELHEIQADDAAPTVTIGAAVPLTLIAAQLGGVLPGVCIAARTVGSPQIRNRGSLGGNLGTASPAGDMLPPLVAAGAIVHVRSASAERSIPAKEFVVAPKKSALAPDELIVSVEIPKARGPQQFAKLGTRNAMVISVCSYALNMDEHNRSFTGAIGSAGPRILSTDEACAELAISLQDAGAWESLHPLEAALVNDFGKRVAAAAQPIDDVRGTAAYRRHALSVMASRMLTWVWDEHRGAIPRGVTVQSVKR
jgi:CO/xanthine dehydrogenase FAD-binding subunit